MTVNGPEWVRTWPNRELHYLPMMGRRFVWDPSIRLIEMDKDYRPVLASLDRSTVITEWDIAFDQAGRDTLEAYIAESPWQVHSVPYRLWPASTGLTEPVWVNRYEMSDNTYRWVNQWDSACDLFGFGFTYLPIELIREFMATNPGPASDTTFSQWHINSVGRRVPIHWDVAAIHLNY